MPPFTPTLREIFLLGVLLVVLLSGTSKLKSSNITVSSLTGLSSDTEPAVHRYSATKSVPFESQYSLQQLSAPLKWGLGRVPETEIVAHVPGTCLWLRVAC